MGKVLTIVGALKAGIKLAVKYTFANKPQGVIAGEFTGVEGNFIVTIAGGAFSYSRKGNPIKKRALFKDYKFPELTGKKAKGTGTKKKAS